jgi:hypothetical protein
MKWLPVLKLGLKTIRLICIAVIYSLFALPLLADHGSASIAQIDNHLSIANSAHSHISPENIHDRSSHSDVGQENTGDHEKNTSENGSGCSMFFCFSFLITSPNNIYRQSISEEHLSLPSVLLFADGKFELHRPPNA